MHERAEYALVRRFLAELVKHLPTFSDTMFNQMSDSEMPTRRSELHAILRILMVVLIARLVQGGCVCGPEM